MRAHCQHRRILERWCVSSTADLVDRHKYTFAVLTFVLVLQANAKRVVLL